MRGQIALVGVLVIACSMLVQAQAAPSAKPGPEHASLAALVGSWSMTGEVKPGNGYGVAAGKVTQIERYQWLPGGFFLQMNRDGKGPWGDVRHIWIFGYDSTAKKYTGQFFELTTGVTASGTATMTGNSWKWLNSGHTADGKPFQERCTVSLVPNISYTVTCETSPDGKVWSPSYEAKATRSQT